MSRPAISHGESEIPFEVRSGVVIPRNSLNIPELLGLKGRDLNAVEGNGDNEGAFRGFRPGFPHPYGRL